MSPEDNPHKGKKESKPEAEHKSKKQKKFVGKEEKGEDGSK